MVNGIKLSDLWLSHSLRTGGEKASPHGAFLLIFCAPLGSGDVICYYLRGGAGTGFSGTEQGVLWNKNMM